MLEAQITDAALTVLSTTAGGPRHLRTTAWRPPVAIESIPDGGISWMALLDQWLRSQMLQEGLLQPQLRPSVFTDFFFLHRQMAILEAGDNLGNTFDYPQYDLPTSVFFPAL